MRSSPFPAAAITTRFWSHNDANPAETALVDAPGSRAHRGRAESARGWMLSDVLITHHHGDHVEGLGPLREAYAPSGDRLRGRRASPAGMLDLAVADGDEVTVAGQVTIVLDVSGHTINHISPSTCPAAPTSSPPTA